MLSITLSSNSGFLLPDLNKKICASKKLLNFFNHNVRDNVRYTADSQMKDLLLGCWESGQQASDRPFCDGLGCREPHSPRLDPLLRVACIQWLTTMRI